MTNKDKLNLIIQYLSENIYHPEDENFNNELYDAILCVEKDLEVLENIKNKTHLLYSKRHQIAKEYEKWCDENNAMVTDTTNLVTWLLSIKMREWLNDK